MKYDLHVHSNISDGKLTRDEIIKMAIKENLEYIAFTEHNDFQLVKPNDNINFQKPIPNPTPTNHHFANTHARHWRVVSPQEDGRNQRFCLPHKDCKRCV